MTGVFSKGGRFGVRCAHGRMPCEDEGRNQGDASTLHGIPQTVSKPPEATTTQGREPSLQASEACPHSDLRFLVLRAARQSIPVLRATRFVVFTTAALGTPGTPDLIIPLD